MYNARECYEVTKKLDEWVHEMIGLEANDDARTDEKRAALFSTQTRKVQVDVYSVKKLCRTGKPPFPLVSARYRVECKSPEFKHEGTDLEALRKLAYAEIEGAQTIKWERVLIPTLYAERNYRLTESDGFAWGYMCVERGTMSDGLLLYREQRRYASERATVKLWPDEMRDKAGNPLAMLDDTPENRRRLDAVRERINFLRERIAVAFSLPNIDESLASLDSLPFFVTARHRVRAAK